MANKQLTAKVKLNVSDAEKKLNKLDTLFKNLNKTTNSVGGNAKLETQLLRSQKQVNNVNNQVKQWANNQKMVTSATKTTNSVLGSIGTKLKGLAATYLGIMGMKAIVNTSDTITSAENRLNALEGGSPEKTAETMDKIYAAAQRARTGYDKMLAGASKTMTIAGDAFQGNMDNAIRFEEIMAKSYTVAGASAEEQVNSMYQLRQALGSGILAGDELRSVREQAPLMYKEIEKFAQEVLQSELSLKDLAAKGVITSDIVVAAVMQAGDTIDKKFEETKMTFAQAWDSIRNTAIRAFQPVLQMLNDGLRSDAGQAAIKGINIALVVLADTILWIGKILGAFFSWCHDNWYWLQWVVFAVVSAIVVYFAIMAAEAIKAGWKIFKQFILSLSPMYLWILLIGVIIALIVYLANQAQSGAEFIFQALMVVAFAFMAVGFVIGSTIMMWIGLIILFVAILFIAFAKCGDKIMGTLYVIGAFISNLFEGLCNFIKGVATNIGIALTNPWDAAKAAFWEFVADTLEGIKWLEPAINAVAKAFGMEGFTVSGEIDYVRGKAESIKQSLGYVDVSNSFSDAFETGWRENARNNGTQKGTELQNKLESFGSKAKDKLSGFGVGDMFGFNIDKYANKLPDPYDPANNVAGGYDPSAANDDIEKALKEIGNDTSDIKGSMQLENDDLEYLRKIAEMEWRNEFTTAEIRVDMTNNNTVNSERDLDGVVEYLSDVLLSEMNNVAYGVHIK